MVEAGKEGALAGTAGAGEAEAPGKWRSRPGCKWPGLHARASLSRRDAERTRRRERLRHTGDVGRTRRRESQCLSRQANGRRVVVACGVLLDGSAEVSQFPFFRLVEDLRSAPGHDLRG